jgi:hypothetical protein
MVQPLEAGEPLVQPAWDVLKKVRFQPPVNKIKPKVRNLPKEPDASSQVKHASSMI